MIEANVEQAVVDHAEGTGWVVRKTKYVGRRGCPDRHFYGYGTVVVVEFKRPSGKPDPHQARERERMRNAGFTVHVIDEAAQGIYILERARRAYRG